VGSLPLESIDRFLVMEQVHADALADNYNVSSDRISLLGTFDPHRRGDEIADPFSHGSRVYDHSYKLIRDCIIGYLDTTGDQF
jgi:protein-tyrosine-phosphatase